MRVAAIIVSLLAPVLLTGQQPSPVFRGGVDLVTIDVTVVDRDGAPVKGLTPDDFVVQLNGQARSVRALDYLDFSPVKEITTEPSAQVTNQVSASLARRGGRVILLVVDDLSAKPSQMTGLRTSAQKMLSSMDVGDLVGLATTSGLGPLIKPTRDRTAVRAALESQTVVGRYDETTAPFYISVPEAIEINQVGGQVFAHEASDIANNATTFARVVNRECGLIVAPGEKIDDTCSAKVHRSAVHLAESITHRASAQLAAYLHLIDALQSAPQPRVLIALSAGVALGADRGDFSELDPVSRAAAKADVRFYALTEESDAIDMADITSERAAARREEGAYFTAAVQTVAEAAGGEAFKVVGQADRFFTRIMNETSGFYRLGVEMPAGPLKDEFLKAKVTVRHAGVTVRVNPHALAPSPAGSGRSIEDALQTRLAQGGTEFGVPMTCATARRRADQSDDVQLAVGLHVPASTPPPLLMRFALVDDAGAVVKSGQQDVARAVANDDYFTTFAIPVVHGQYRLRVAVADRDGHIGAIEQAVAAELNHVGSWLASDLLLSWTAADESSRFLGLEILPKTATHLRVSLELYPTATASLDSVSVRLQILQAGSTVPAMEHDLTAADRGGWLAVTGDVPVSAFPPGVYAIRAIVLQGGNAVRTVSGSFRKQE